MQVRKRSIIYSGVMAAVALVLSVALLQLAQFGGQATARAETQLDASTLTITKTVMGSAPSSDWAFVIVAQNGVEVDNQLVQGAVTKTIPAIGGSLSLTMAAGYVTVTEVTKPGYAVWSGCLGSAYGFSASDAQVNGVSMSYTNTQTTTAVGPVGAICEFVNVAPFSLTVIKDAVPDSSQPFTISVFSGIGIEEADIPLVDDGTGLSNTAVITGVMEEVTQTYAFVEEYPMPEGWLPTNLQCVDENGEPVGNEPLRSAGVSPDRPMDNIYFDVMAGKQYTCTFTNGAPALTLDKTVGTDPAVCAATQQVAVQDDEDEVTYCYKVTNTGGLTMTMHGLEDDKLGVLADDIAYTLAPGASTFVTHTVPAPTIETTNVATWTASMTYTVPVPQLTAAEVMQEEVVTLTASSTATATVTLAPTGIDVDDQPQDNSLFLPQIVQ